MSSLSKAAAETANWHIAHTWADGLDLTYAGVALADCAVYPILSTLGKIALGELAEKEIADGQPNG